MEARKTVHISFRFTPEHKAAIDAFCRVRSLNVTEFLLKAVDNEMAFVYEVERRKLAEREALGLNDRGHAGIDEFLDRYYGQPAPAPGQPILQSLQDKVRARE